MSERLGARLAAGALACALAGCGAHMRFVCPAKGGPAWHEVESEHVLLQTDLEEPAAVAMARQLELLRALVAAGLGLDASGVPGRLEVVAFATREELADFTGDRWYSGFSHVGPDGRLQELLGGPLDRGDDQALVAAQGMAHALVYRLYPRQPPWLSMGLAIYLSSVARPAHDGSRTVGTLPQRWLQWQLQHKHQPPLRELLAWRALPGQEVAYQAKSWILVRFLELERPGALAEYSQRLAKGDEGLGAWNATFPEWSLERPGGPEALDALLAARSLDFSQPGKRVAAQVNPRPRTRSLTAAEVHTARLDFPHDRKPGALRAEIEEALSEDPGHVLALERKAELDGRDKEASARQAVKAHPEDPDAWEFLASALPTGSAEREAALRKVVERSWPRANRVAALALELGRKGNPDAGKLSRQAVEMAPWSLTAAYARSLALFGEGRCAEAGLEIQRALELGTGQLGADDLRGITEAGAGWRRTCEERTSAPAQKGGRGRGGCPVDEPCAAAEPSPARAAG